MSGLPFSGIELTAADAAIRFTKPNDRFEHHLCVQINGQWIRLLEAYLQNSQADWPTDPAIQQLVLEPIGPEPYPDVALGVGMSGHGHWSLAAQWVELSKGNCAIQLDYACRQQPPVDFLGSTYRLAQDFAKTGLHLIRIETGPQRWGGWFSMEGSQSGHQLSIEVLAGRLDYKPDSQTIEVRPEGSLEKPSTLRWCYRIAWLSCNE
jgi:hypothetical protein